MCGKKGSLHRCERCGRNNHVAPCAYEVGSGLTLVGGKAAEGAGQRVNCPVDEKGCCVLPKYNVSEGNGSSDDKGKPPRGEKRKAVPNPKYDP